MNATMKAVLLAVLDLALCALGMMLRAFIERLGEDEASAPVALAIVRGINADHPDWSGEEKRRWAFDAIKQHNVALSDSTTNALIEMAVQVAKRETATA